MGFHYGRICHENNVINYIIMIMDPRTPLTSKALPSTILAANAEVIAMHVMNGSGSQR